VVFGAKPQTPQKTRSVFIPLLSLARPKSGVLPDFGNENSGIHAAALPRAGPFPQNRAKKGPYKSLWVYPAV
jgi:hypothetical protein